MGKTLFEKIWDRHLVASIDESTNLVFIDLHLVHEVTSPQAFDSLRLAGRKVKHPEMTLATVDHGVPTSNRLLGIKDPLSKIQIEALENNCEEFGVTLFGINDPIAVVYWYQRVSIVRGSSVDSLPMELYMRL